MHSLFKQLVLSLKTLNIFGSFRTTDDEYESRSERISTRLFLILFVSSIIIIIIYTSQIDVTNTIEVKNPSYEQYQSLNSKHSQTLRCPCENLAIKYNLFASLQPKFHQLCSSDFIGEDWINAVDATATRLVSDDFSYIGSLIFSAFAAFCQIANDTIQNNLQVFDSTEFITDEILQPNIFFEQSNSIIQSFQSSTQLTYYQSFAISQYFIRMNQLLSSLFSNVKFEIQFNGLYWSTTVLDHTYSNSTCNCSILNMCTDPLTLEDHRLSSNQSLLYSIPGLLKGCYLIDALRESTLECFYDPSCISTIKEYLSISSILTKPLNESLNNQFNRSSTIDELLSKGMTDHWIQNISHENYYQQCQVSSCTYAYMSKYGFIYIITTLIGLIGGLTKVLRTIIHPIVKAFRARFYPKPAQIMVVIPKISLIERIRRFNYFSKSISNPLEIKKQIITTRVFFILLIFSCIILISYYSTIPVSISYQIKSPTFDQYLALENQQRTNPSFICPCSTLAISYETFVNIKYVLHPFCNAKSLQQILISIMSTQLFLLIDFRKASKPFFEGLVALCELSVEHIDKNINSFNSSTFITNLVYNPIVFEKKIDEVINTFKSSTEISLLNILNFLSTMERNNLLFNTQGTNFQIAWVPNEMSSYLDAYVSPYLYNLNTSNIEASCDCLYSIECQEQMALYSVENYMPVISQYMDGFVRSCLAFEGLRYSNLGCLFNQTCFQSMLNILGLTSADKLDSNDLNQISFQSNTTIAELLQQLFVNQWNISVSHQNFYEQCRPNSCTYALSKKNSFWILLTILLSLVGGLVKILQFLVPHFIQLIYSSCKQNSNEQRRQSNLSFQLILKKIKDSNMFSSENPLDNDEYHKQTQILSTRVFIVVFLICIISLTIFSSQKTFTKTVRYENPTIEQYEYLYKDHREALQCPCQQISIKQKTFLSLQPTFHQICQSRFIDSHWAAVLAIMPKLSRETYGFYDFRLLGGPIFRTIASLCQFSSITIEEKLVSFYDSQFISTHTISQESLIRQGESAINLFISNIEHIWLTELLINRHTMHKNQLLPAAAPTVVIVGQIFNSTYVQLEATSTTFNDSLVCSCRRDPTCIIPAAVYTSNVTIMNFKPVFFIPGFYSGCYIVESTFKSNLHILYNQSWIDEFRNLIQYDYYSPIEFQTPALNKSVQSQYNLTTSIENIAKHLMIENWNPFINYSSYYEQCQPTECSYTYTVKSDFIYIFTTIIALIGGLMTILQLIIPRAVKFIRNCFSKRQQQTPIQVIALT